MHASLNRMCVPAVLYIKSYKLLQSCTSQRLRLCVMLGFSTLVLITLLTLRTCLTAQLISCWLLAMSHVSTQRASSKELVMRLHRQNCRGTCVVVASNCEHVIMQHITWFLMVSRT